MNKIGWTSEERVALHAIAATPAFCVKSKHNPKASVRLYDQGYVFKDLYGHLRLTDEGKKLLRSL